MNSPPPSLANLWGAHPAIVIFFVFLLPPSTINLKSTQEQDNPTTILHVSETEPVIETFGSCYVQLKLFSQFMVNNTKNGGKHCCSFPKIHYLAEAEPILSQRPKLQFPWWVLEGSLLTAKTHKQEKRCHHFGASFSEHHNHNHNQSSWQVLFQLHWLSFPSWPFSQQAHYQN